MSEQVNNEETKVENQQENSGLADGELDRAAGGGAAQDPNDIRFFKRILVDGQIGDDDPPKDLLEK